MISLAAPRQRLDAGWERLKRWARPHDQAAAIFARIRWRLTAWYSSVLVAALLLFGVVFYLALDETLLGPVDGNLRLGAEQASQRCGESLLIPQFPLPRDQAAFYSCYNTRGATVDGTALAERVPQFVEHSLALTALRKGSSEDTIQTDGALGSFRRYAQVVQDGQGTILGVVQVGEQVGPQLHALEEARRLLLLLGGLALLIASLGGLLLANRALLPARLAYARQRDFIADASHELRTPLTMLRADAEVLLRGRSRLDPEDAALLEDVVSEAAHMAALANGMLNLARLDGTGAVLEQEVLDLTQLAGDTAKRVAAFAAERAVQVTAVPGPPALVVGDRLLLEQAALVLTDNAIKYNRPGGTVTITASTGPREALLEVRDSGIGISGEHLPRLGERFYRVDKARSREAGSSGLGLAIAQGIILRHGGTLQFSSEPDQGTIAILRLPAAGPSR